MREIGVKADMSQAIRHVATENRFVFPQQLAQPEKETAAKKMQMHACSE
jgi:hypothetical protein